MARSKIFISYCHEDEKALDQLRPFLRPLEDRGLLDVWDDTRLLAGDDWAAEIGRTLGEATVAVLLVSSDFLASEFITEREVPPILAAADAGELTVVPVFLRPSMVDELDYTFPTADGEKSAKLTRFQGFGRPDRPLSDLTWSDRERTYTKLVKRLRQLTGEPVVTQRRRAPRARSTVTHEPAKLYVLTVRFERAGSDLAVEYSLPGSEPAPRPRARAAAPAASRRQRARPPSATALRADRGGHEEAAGHLARLGHLRQGTPGAHEAGPTGRLAALLERVPSTADRKSCNKCSGWQGPARRIGTGWFWPWVAYL